MLAIGFRFLAGRYHATPWGRHVNEADIEWPPSHWRICRALISTWHHKLDHAEFTITHLEALIDQLSETHPRYSLPTAVHTHTRHYMPQYRHKTALVFDAFARIDSKDELIVAWPELDLLKPSHSLLKELLPKMGYLGRAESWVEARVVTEALSLAKFECFPGNEPVDVATGEIKGEVISLFNPVTAKTYRQWRDAFVGQELTELKGAAKKNMAKTVPDTLTAALSLDTADFHKVGWSRPPAGEPVHYLRPLDSLRAKRNPAKIYRPKKTPTTARFILMGKPLPRIEDTLRVGEWFRSGLTGQAKRIFGAHGIPPELSGHNLEDGNRHGHAFYLAEDADGDGRVDHVIVHAQMGFSAPAKNALQRLSRLWHKRGYKAGMEYQVVLEALGGIENFSDDCTLFGVSTHWISKTPYLHPWHLKKKLSVEDQIKKECRSRNLPELVSLERLDTLIIRDRKRTVGHFHKFRSKRGLVQPDTNGSFWKLTFQTPINGPLALGFGCHYGLGMFAPDL